MNIFNDRFNSVWVQEVIISTKELRGEGITGDPYRRITQVFTLTGELIAEYDSYIKNTVPCP